MARHLIVKSPFGSYGVGDRITADVEAIQAAHPHQVVAIDGDGPVVEVATDLDPAPEPEAVQVEADPPAETEEPPVTDEADHSADSQHEE
jgi:hypothetical protein